MKNKVLELMNIFDLKLTSADARPDGEVTVDFENEFSWATVSYHCGNQELSSVTVESKDRKFYYQFCPNGDYYGDGVVGLEVYEDIVEKSKAIWKNEPFDQRIMVELELEEAVKEELINAAKLQGVTVDEFVEQALIGVIEKYENDQLVDDSKNEKVIP